MEHVYKLSKLDCAGCAAEAESAIGKIEGISSCRISFLQLKMWIDCPNLTPDIEKQIHKALKKKGAKGERE